MIPDGNSLNSITNRRVLSDVTNLPLDSGQQRCFSPTVSLGAKSNLCFQTPQTANKG